MAPGRADDTPDYYDLLSIPASASESEIRRAYRKTSLLYHPDKVTPTPETLEKFQLLQTALDVLTDVEEKAKYDRTREAKLRRKVEEERLEERRKKLKKDLEGRENEAMTNGVSALGAAGVKRNWSQRELEINRIKEENRLRREAVMGKKVEEAREREKKDAEEKMAQEKEEEGSSEAMDRSVKVRWVKEGEGLEIDAEAIEGEFPTGEVESVLLLKDKKRRIEGRSHRVVLGTAVVVFTTKAIAKRVVANGPWEGMESVGWAAEKDADPP
jgi:DnaJ homolog subfamily C member 17